MTSGPTLIEFPCDFQIKIMGKNTSSFKDNVAHLAHQHYKREHVISIEVKPSKLGNYLAITLTVRAHDKKTLDALYQDLTKLSDVKMVL